MTDPEPPSEFLDLLKMALASEPPLSPPANTAPVRDCIVDHLIDMLLSAGELLQLLQLEEASPLLWIEPRIVHVAHEVDAALKRVAN